MTDTNDAAALQAVEVALKRRWLRLHDEWVWILNHSWSMRFMFIAFLLSAAEAFLPLFVGKTSIPPLIYAGAIALVSGAAMVARLVAQTRAESTDGK